MTKPSDGSATYGNGNAICETRAFDGVHGIMFMRTADNIDDEDVLLVAFALYCKRYPIVSCF